MARTTSSNKRRGNRRTTTRATARTSRSTARVSRRAEEVRTTTPHIVDPFWQRTTLIWVAIIILLAFGLYIIVKSNSSTPANNTTAQQSGEITYQGIEGKTALQILKDTHQVETKSYEGLGELVQSIDGRKPDDNSFWAFYVNGQPSDAGASSYVTKASDTITWKIESYQ